MNLIIISINPPTESKGCDREDGYWMYEVYVWARFGTSINIIAHSAKINNYHCSFLVDGGQTFHSKRQTSLKTYEYHVLILLSTQFQIKKNKMWTNFDMTKTFYLRVSHREWETRSFLGWLLRLEIYFHWKWIAIKFPSFLSYWIVRFLFIY